MRIAFDMSIARINQAGTGIYATNLIKMLHQFDLENEYHIFAVDQQRDMSSSKSIYTRLDTIYRDLIWTHGVLPWQVARSHVDLLHMPANVIPLISPCKTVVSILDGIIFQSPEKFPFWHRNYARRLVPFAARKAARVLTISEQSKRDLVKYLNIDPDKVTVTYLAASSEFQLATQAEMARIRQVYDLNTFILTVGTLEPRKNTIHSLRAFAQLRANGFPGLLVHAGPKGWLYEEVLAEVNRLHLQDSVRFLGRVPIKDLVGLYNAATLFVYPSLYEGFGLPVLEAMACGCPVVTSNVSSLPEVAGDAAVMIDPTNVQQLTMAMEKVLANKAFATDLIQRGLQQSKRFSWERCAQETLAVYRQVLNA